MTDPSMKAAVYHAPDDLRYEELRDPAAGPGEIVVRMTRCGLCGTDLGKVRYGKVPAGTVLGHELVGEVAEVGADVGRVKPGERVVVSHHVPCLSCVYCRHENYSLCATFKRNNLDPGGFAEMVRVLSPSVERGLWRLPDDVTDDEALFVEPLACCIRGMRRARVQPGDTVAILGCGPIGLAHVQLSRIFGAGGVIGVDPIDSRAKRAETIGADVGIVADGEAAVRAVREATAGIGPDIVLNTVGRLEVYEQAFAMVRDGGHVVFFAECPPESRLTLDPGLLCRNEVGVIGSYSPAPDDLPRALDLIRRREVEVASLISHRIPLARMSEAVRLAGTATASLKIVLVP